MPPFIKDFNKFSGTNEANEKGQDLESFLEAYDPNKYENPCVTADILVFRYTNEIKSINNGLQLLMVKRANHPSIGFHALPGGFVNIRENIEDAARRELLEETGVENVAIEQIYTWGEYDRDPRARIITVAYLALIADEEIKVTAGDDAADALWFDVTFECKETKEVIAIYDAEEKSKNTTMEGATESITEIVNNRAENATINIKDNIIENAAKDTTINSAKNIRIENTYELKLTNKEKGIHLTATVTVQENKFGLLKEKCYRVLASEGIAFDHPRFITQALLYIKDLLE